jgi:osmotically-inducible protein OsmY
MRRPVGLIGASALWFATVAAPQPDGFEQFPTAEDLVGRGEDQVEALLNHELRISGVISQVDAGTATLDGIVTNEADRVRVERLARATPGIMHVRNRVIVTREVSEVLHAGAPLPPALDSAVLARLGADAQLADRDIDVRLGARNAVVLSGQVESEAERVLAGRIAAETPSVTEVRNRLDVRPE